MASLGRNSGPPSLNAALHATDSPSPCRPSSRSSRRSSASSWSAGLPPGCARSTRRRRAACRCSPSTSRYPVLLLRTVAQTEMPAQPEWGFVFAYFSGAFAIFALGGLAARLLFARRGAAPAIFGISASFSNTTILGIPIVLRAFGDAAAVPLALILGFHSALLFTLTTVVAEIGAGLGVPLPTLLRNVGTRSGHQSDPLGHRRRAGAQLRGRPAAADARPVRSHARRRRIADRPVRARRQSQPLSPHPHAARSAAADRAQDAWSSRR